MSTHADLYISAAPVDAPVSGAEIRVVEAPVADAQAEDEILIIEESSPEPVILEEPAVGTGTYSAETAPPDPATQTPSTRFTQGDFSVGLDKAWLEFGHHYPSRSAADTSNYGHLAFSAEWQPAPAWETRLSGRIDGYRQTGDSDFDEVELDYGDSFVRYRGDGFRVTAGAQKIIWGRIDELPPTDRMSRVDLARGVLDDLSDRRRAMPVLRYEGFQGGYKFDAVWLPDFRKAYLPEKNSVWHPVNQTKGTLLGFEPDPVLQQFVSNGTVSASAPGGDGGIGLRLSNTGERLDYAVTVQRARQSTPYWELNPEVRTAFLGGADPVSAIAASSEATFQARYPRSWVVGGDLGFEARGATWRFEAAWISDTPVTRKDLRYDTVNSVNWAAGVQFYPGDSDVRVNLQLAAINLIDSPSVLDRDNIYNFNGTVFGEFGNNRWQSGTRFFIGLDEKDIYINPEIAFIGWEPHEIYAGWHYFDGDDGTLGGYWEDNSLLTLGWRARF